MKIKSPIVSLFNRRSFENPNTSLLDAINGLNIGPTSSGVVVNNETALMFDAVFTANRILSETIATLPLIVYEKISDTERREATEHPVHRLLKTAPNPDMTAPVLMERKTFHLTLTGNGYCRIRHNGAGIPKRIDSLNPGRTLPSRLRNTDELVYTTSTHDGRQLVLAQEEVLHVPGFGFDGILGMSPIHYLRNTIGNAIAAQEFQSAVFKNKAWLGSVLEHPDLLSPEASRNLKASFNTDNAGFKNAGGVLIAEENMKWKQVQMPRDDAMFLTLLKFTRTQIGSIYRIPAHMMNDAEGTSGQKGNVEQTATDFLRFTMNIYLRKFEVEFTKKLLEPPFFCEFNTNILLRADLAGRIKAYNAALTGGWMNRNEIRTKENLTPIKGGEKFFVPVNMQELEEEKGANNPSGNEETAEPTPITQNIESNALTPEVGLKVLLAGITDTAKRMARKEKDRLQRAGKKDDNQFNLWKNEFYPKWAEDLRVALKPHLESFEEFLAIAGHDTHSEFAIDQVRNDTKKEVEKLCSSTASQWRGSNQLEEYLKTAIEHRTKIIVDTFMKKAKKHYWRK